MQWENPSWARQRDYVHTSIPMSGYGPNTSDNAVLDYFRPEWGEGSYGDSQRDYEIWLADRAFREGGLRTIYWDIFYISEFNSLQTGTAYTLPDGRRQPTYNGFNQRKFMMRLRADMADCGLLPGALTGHSTNSYPLVAFPWMDAVLDGEWAEIKDTTPLDWVDQYSLARMRAMSVSDTWGVQISWMNLFHVSDQARMASLFRSFMDYQRLHDTWTGQDGRVPPEPVLEWGLNDARVQYVPYWRNTLVTSPDKDVLISLWRLPDRVLLLAFNNDGKQVKDVKLKVDLQGLGLNTSYSGEGAISARELGGAGDPPVEYNAGDNSVLVPGLQPHTARYLGLRVWDGAYGDGLLTKINNHATGQTASAPPNDMRADFLDWGMMSKETKFFDFGKVATVRGTVPGIEPGDVAVA